MSTQTTKRGLFKPEPSDFVSVVTDIDNNMDNLDDAVPDSRKVNGHALTSDVTVTKGDVGLGNVDNTSDANKPISDAVAAKLGTVPSGSTLQGEIDELSQAKADKVNNATSGDLASLDANGNLTDSGKKVSDFVPVTREINGHALSDDFDISKSDVGLGNVDNTSDENKPVSTLQQAALDGKADKVSNATNGNFAGLNTSGNLTDSGKKAADFVLVANIATLVETQAMINDYYVGG